MHLIPSGKDPGFGSGAAGQVMCVSGSPKAIRSVDGIGAAGGGSTVKPFEADQPLAAVESHVRPVSLFSW
jgi:hypothetical protein